MLATLSTFDVTAATPSGVTPSKDPWQLQPVPTFYSLQRPEIPPLPFNPFPELPLYSIGEHSWVYDDRSVDYVQLELEARLHALALAAETALRAASAPPRVLEGDPPLSVIIAKELTNAFATLTVTNCVYGHRHLVLSKTNLNDMYWNSEFVFMGPSDPVKTFTVPATLPMKFFEAVELTSTNAIVSLERIDNAVEPPGPGNQSGRFQVSRSDVISLPALTVCYVIGGTASNGEDYAALSGAVIHNVISNCAY